MPTTLVLNEPCRARFYAPSCAAIARGDLAREGIALRLETAGDPARAAARRLPAAGPGGAAPRHRLRGADPLVVPAGRPAPPRQ